MIKTFAKTALTGAVLAALATGAFAAASGTYTGEAQGRNGPVKVEVTLADGKITAVKVVSHKESTGIADPAIERIPAAIAAEQSAAVDVVGGATLTSDAIKAAVLAALTSAGVDTASYMKKPDANAAANQPVKEVTTDVLVIGAGNGGITAAVKAAESGKKVILIEKRPAAGGVSALNHGGLAATGTRYQREVMKETKDSPELLYKDMLRVGKNANDPVLAKMVSERTGEVGDWLIDDLKVAYGAAWVQFPDHSAHRQISAKGNSVGWQKTMLEVFKKHGGVLMTDMRATDFITDKDGNVTGVKATGLKGQPYEFDAKSFVLASGGYGAVKSMLPERMKDVLFYGIPTETGDGFKMGTAIGAGTINLDYVKTYPNGVEVQPGRSMDTTGSSTFAVRGSAIFVNVDGKRCVNENKSLGELTQATLAQKNHLMYLVMDQKAWEAYVKKAVDDHTVPDASTFEAWKSLRNNGRPVICTGELDVCAKEMGIDPKGLVQTVKDWNAAVVAGEDKAFGRKALVALGDGPYHIVEQKARYQTTLGGLRANADMQILTKEGKPIGNLYGAGCVVGGANGADSMTTLMNTWAIVSGYVAGESAVKNAK